MPLTKNHALALGYTKGSTPRDNARLDLFIHDELRKIEMSLKRTASLLPQAAAAEPEEKFIGMQRLALHDTWDPLSAGVDKWVSWDGTAWVAI